MISLLELSASRDSEEAVDRIYQHVHFGQECVAMDT